MPVIRAVERATKQGAASNFTGTVFQDEVVVGTTPSRMRASVVSFTPGARTAWHAHPVGQTLYCLSGVGRICFDGEKAAGAQPRRYRDDSARRDALAWCGTGPAVRASCDVGEQRHRRRHVMG